MTLNAPFDDSFLPSALVCVPPGHVFRLWPAVEAMIDAAYVEMDLPTPDVRGWLLAEKGLLWIVGNGDSVLACATTSLVQHRSGLCCRIVAAGGPGSGLSLWRIHIADIERYALGEGCVKVKIEGRRGWGKILTGYAPTSICLEKRL
jgi:hypothetical protein